MFFFIFIQYLFCLWRYTRNLVDTGNGKYNLILLCWGEGHGSGIHDHADAHCFMKILEGSLQEIRFAWPKSENEQLVETGRKVLPLNGVCYMNGIYASKIMRNCYQTPLIAKWMFILFVYTNENRHACHEMTLADP